MRNEYSLRDYKRLFALCEKHSLSIERSYKETRGNTVFETRWINEHNADHTLVARYRIWNNLSTTPPYRQQNGWERYSISGDLLDREVTYSKRENNEWLH